MTTDAVIEHIMRTDFLRLSPSMPIREAVAAFARGRESAAPVIDGDGALAGILTEKDCFRPMLNACYYQQWDGSVAAFMTRDVRALSVDLDLVSAAEEFLARSHRVYPVLRDGEIVGLLHRSDLFAAILALSERGAVSAG
ncbi:MAG: CBS domain-containing protein [Mesorhizobium sp.]|nr:CBS domain-containing protein [Mesorhizobium sp.]